MPPRQDQLYMLFLKKDETDPKGWTIVGGSQGQFELDLSNDKVRPGDLKKNSPIGLKYRGMNAKQFLKKVRRMARQGPNNN